MNIFGPCRETTSNTTIYAYEYLGICSSSRVNATGAAVVQSKQQSMCNGLEGLFLALVEIDPCEMAKGTITECILDHPFNSGSTTIIIRLLPEQLSNIIVQHRWDPDFNPQPPSVTANGIYTYSFFCPKNVGRVVYWKKKNVDRERLEKKTVKLFSCLFTTTSALLSKTQQLPPPSFFGLKN